MKLYHIKVLITAMKTFKCSLIVLCLAVTASGRSNDLGACRDIDTSKRYYCPVMRYCVWDFYSGSTRSFLEETGYVRGEWNYKGVSSVENVIFESLATAAQTNLAAVGYDADRHDCCNNHYSNFAWSDFDESKGYKGVRDAFAALGHDENSWTNSVARKYDDFYWDELPPAVQQIAYDELCYTRELWDKIPLGKWPIDAKLPGELLPGEHEDLKCLLKCTSDCENASTDSK